MKFRLQESAQAQSEAIKECPACNGEGIVGVSVQTFTVCQACNGQKIVVK